jgi:segregation and condensation protein B
VSRQKGRGGSPELAAFDAARANAETAEGSPRDAIAPPRIPPTTESDPGEFREVTDPGQSIARGIDDDGSAEVEKARELSHEHLRGLLEALVFASDKPQPSAELAKMASAPLKHVNVLMRELKEHYAQRGIVLDEVAGGWVFRTSVQFAPFVRDLTAERPVKLTRAQVETLAIAAYRQPITRPEIDEIRGVDSGATIKLLLERDLLRILGKKDEPGRPLLYGTTTHFLQFFGLKSLKDLPTLREFTELSEDSRRVADEGLAAAFTDPSALCPPEPDRANEPADAPAEGDSENHDTVIPSAPPTGDLDDES